MSDREAILAALPPGRGTRAPNPEAPIQPVKGDILAAFKAKARALNVRVASLKDLKELLDRTWVVDYDAWPLVESLEPQRTEDVWSAQVGVTRADLGVAETGSLLIGPAEGRRRLASLAPPLHVALLRPEDVVPSLEDAFVRLPAGNAALITGPSRTADIEGTLVPGIHGPGELWVVIL